MLHKILIVDDDPANIALVVDVLTLEQTSLFVANNGETALKIAKNENPHLIILDWQMPVMDGLSFLKTIKQDSELKETLVIMMTGIRTDNEDLLLAFDKGVIDFLRKPIVKTELLARVKSMLYIADLHKEKIEQKNRELVTFALKTIESNELNGEIIKLISSSEDRIQHIDPALYNDFVEMKNKINLNLKAGIWKQFEDSFIKINPLFYSNLITKHSNLSKSELKLCALLRLNLDSKEIAAILSQEYDSVRVSRTRLRKKLNLETETNLIAYLMKL